ncbi:MAG: alanine--glyoxylate aminotransferase family protein [Acidobacteriia bacterium]|nr:alanine--glyoxylate aminotransferase family protein [Terriglobia bacterium]
MIDQTLTMIPGPTPVHPRILEALARPTVSHLAPEFVEAFRAAIADFRWLCQSREGQPFIVAGGGTLAMEIGLVNVVEPGERILVVSQGYFGDRYAELAGAFGIEADVVRSEWGRAVAPEELAVRLAAGSYAAVTITHVDTSTGTAAPAAAYCELLRGRRELVILDGVCATGGIDEPCDTWGVDVLVTAPQKAIGAPPGLALCLFSPRAMARRRERRSVPAYYADVLRWLPIMEDPGRYYSTPCVNEVFAFGQALRMVRAEGMSTRVARHSGLAGAVRAGLEALGVPLFTAPDCRADTLSVALLPPGVEDAPFRKAMAARGIVVAGGLGPISGKAFRLGHMGNIGPAEVAATLIALEGSLLSLGAAVTPGAAVAGAASHLAALQR